MLNIYGLDDHIIEIYKQTQRQLEDVELLEKLLGDGSPKRVLEPFCGTGRVFMGLAACGHEIFGMDSSSSMLSEGRRKLAAAPEGLRRRVTLARKDVMAEEWPRGFDAVLLANNSLYELPSPELQLDCLRRAAGCCQRTSRFQKPASVPSRREGNERIPLQPVSERRGPWRDHAPF
ncbi:MAG: hypothetical protein FD189_2334 [Elusimicrobia bacterium]|nr:MAG: hypothetical protein FD154_2328 [Elusimicrobiota bacterium]KAF0153696.1 MAG: hypothetical protein FD189_2334 [Elusimicrobiota bacterium]